MTPEARLRVAFETAQDQLKVPPILDVDDLLLEPDSKSIQLYVSYLYKAIDRPELSMKSAGDAIQAVIKLRDKVTRKKNMEKLEETATQVKAMIEEFDEIENKITGSTIVEPVNLIL